MPTSQSDSFQEPKAHYIETSTILNQSPDDAFLASLGYRQEFKRQFSKIELFGVSFSIIGVLPSIASVLVFAIPNGGTSALVWGWAVCSVFLTFIAMAVGELGSAMPTSGGLYYWTFSFSSPRWRCLLSWIVGYSNTIGLISGVASVDWGCAVQIMAAASIGSDMTFVPTTQQTFGLFVALLFVHAVVCSMATRVLARLQNVYITLNILLVFGVIIALPAATPKAFKNSASYALGGFSNLNGWPNGYAFILSFLAPLWTIGAFDSSVHISEEATNSRTAVPFACISATVIAAVLGWAVNMAIAFNMGTDMEGILSNPIGQPLATIFFNSFGKNGTLALWTLIVVVQFMMGSSLLLASSRQTFAFARDGGLPFSGFIYHVNPHTSTPVNAVCIAAICALLLGLLAFAGATAISAIFALTIVGQFVAYSIPITARFAFKNNFKPGPFCLGKLSLPVAVVAVVWMAFTTIVLFFPATPHPVAEGMNYTVVVLGGVLIFALIYFYFPRYGGKYWFKGPINRILQDQELEGEKQGAQADSVIGSVKVEELSVE